MPTVVHFEIPAEDLQRAKKFYEGLFGWKIESMPGSEGYLVISTTDDKGEKGLDGGMMQKQHPEHRPTNYIDVPSVDEYSAKAAELGGQVVMPKTPVPGMGYFAVCIDTEGNCVGLWETDPAAKS
jgi:predicted enzyme related to lactoylglutathione lyase